MHISQSGAAAAVAACLRNGGTAFGFDAEQWADIILMGGEPQDLYNRLAALIEPENEQSRTERQHIHEEIAELAEVAA